MRLQPLFLAVLLGLLMSISASSAAGACDPLECSELSYSFGSTYCSGNDVYIKYREYYCSGFDCVFRDTERMIDECRLGCSQGICITCDDAACRAKSSYVGTAYCKDGDVYREYRDYECKFEEGCVYEVINRMVEECVGECKNGQCGCDAVDCVKRSGYYGDPFCKADNDVYREYRQYFCTGYSYDSRCMYNRTEAKIADCQYSCSSGACISLCQPDCAAKSGYVNESYCKDGDVYRKYMEYYCVSDSCVYNEKETRVQDCKKLCRNAACADEFCVNRCDSWGEWMKKNNTYERTRTCYNYTAECVLKISYNEIARRNITTEEKTKEIRFDVDTESIQKDVTIDYPDARIYNGLFFGSKGIAASAEGKIVRIKFTVKDTNNLAPLIISVGNEKVYRDTPSPGEYIVDVNEPIDALKVRQSSSGKRIKIETLSSGWQFWASSFYEISGIEINVITHSLKENEFDFTLGKELAGFEKASLIFPENVTAIINGNPVRADSISSDSFSIENKIKFVPLENTKTYGKAVLKVWYLEEK